MILHKDLGFCKSGSVSGGYSLRIHRAVGLENSSESYCGLYSACFCLQVALAAVR